MLNNTYKIKEIKTPFELAPLPYAKNALEPYICSHPIDLALLTQLLSTRCGKRAYLAIRWLLIRPEKKMKSDPIHLISYSELEKRFHSQVSLSFIEDKALLGGVIIRVGHWMLDGSVKGKWSRLKEELKF